jgi:YidC/Oxa1 family membrane protein insertase
MEKRLLLAAVLSLGVLFLWESIASKNAPKRPVPGSPASSTAVAGSAGTKPTGSVVAAPVVTPSVAVSPVVGGAVSASEEKTTVLANDLVRATFSNRGAVLTSYVLLKHLDETRKPLELVRPVLPPAPRPFSVSFPGRPDLDARVSGALFAVETEGFSGSAVRFRFSDGTVSVTKDFRLEPGYLMDVSTSVGGAAYQVSLGTGLRAESEKEAATPYAPPAAAVATTGGSLRQVRVEKLEKPQSWPLDDPGFVGLEDNYFLAALIPRATAAGYAEAVPLKDAAGKPAPLITAGLAPVSPAALLVARAYFGPKDVDVLKNARAGLERTVDFGWYGILAGPLLWLLKRANTLVGNYGVAILLVTLLIRILLFPLMHKSYGSMKKMQKLQPRMNAIRDKYKKAKTDATQRAKMNEEIMKLYQSEGYNPMSGCFPILLQLPILVAFYNVLSKSIELRHAPFVFWIKDLSAIDPTYVLVILMVVSMYVQQAMTPTTVDPAQKKLFMAMPLLWGFFMRNYPSGLILYWLFSNILTVFQQMIINKMGSRDEPEGETGAKSKGKQKKLRQASA